MKVFHVPIKFDFFFFPINKLTFIVYLLDAKAKMMYLKVVFCFVFLCPLSVLKFIFFIIIIENHVFVVCSSVSVFICLSR